MEQHRRLTVAQERLWFLQQFNDVTSVYNEHLCVRVSGPLSAPALYQALVELTRTHQLPALYGRRVYADLVGAGHAGAQEPFDAF